MAYTGSSRSRCGGLGLVCGGAVADVCFCSVHSGSSNLLQVSVYTCVVVSFVFGLLGKLLNEIPIKTCNKLHIQYDAAPLKSAYILNKDLFLVGVLGKCYTDKFNG